MPATGTDAIDRKAPEGFFVAIVPRDAPQSSHSRLKAGGRSGDGQGRRGGKGNDCERAGGKGEASEALS